MRRPEILAPVGDVDSLAAALGAGADAVYLGLDEGLNARARATNFSLDGLGEVADRVHAAGARLYLTMNTLVFEAELGWVEAVLRRVAAAGVDALIVQDPAVCLLARAVAPTLELHASTQMTLSSPEGLALARSLGISRVVLPRELSTAEIRRLAAQTELELEVFVHGALCMSWSGQCLTSEAWGGRSANRGQCAQSCRLPYELVVDGVLRPLADVRYLLSPLDLAGMRAVPELVEIGVHSLKIEGRLKGPAYVAAAVQGYQRMLDAVEAGRLEEGARQAAVDLGQMAVTYSRGFSDGFFAGSDHQDLVEGRFPKHRGALLGRVAEVTPTAVRVTREARAPSVGAAVGGGLAVGTVSSPLPAMAGASADDARGVPMVVPEPRPGVGIGFDTGRPHEVEPGGRLFGVEPAPGGWWLRFRSAGAGPAAGPAGPPGVDELGPGGRRGRARGGGEAGVGAGAADDGRDGGGRRAGDHSLDRAGGGARGRAGAAGVGRPGAR
jgi:putative protease